MSHAVSTKRYEGLHGALAQFDTPEELLDACEKAYAEGYRKMDAYAPMPVEGLAEAIGYKKNKVALCVLIAGCCAIPMRRSTSIGAGTTVRPACACPYPAAPRGASKTACRVPM